MSLSLSSSRAVACQRSAAPRRAATVRVSAIFGGGRDAADASERKKQEQMDAQRAILEERRAKRDAFLRGEGTVKGGRVGPRSKARSIEEFTPAPPPLPKSRKEIAYQADVDDDDEEEAPKGNPLAGLFGGLFGKK